MCIPKKMSPPQRSKLNAALMHLRASSLTPANYSHSLPPPPAPLQIALQRTTNDAVHVSIYHTYGENKYFKIKEVIRTEDQKLIIKYKYDQYDCETTEDYVAEHRFVYVELWKQGKEVEDKTVTNIYDFGIFEWANGEYTRQPAAFLVNMNYIQYLRYNNYFDSDKQSDDDDDDEEDEEEYESRVTSDPDIDDHEEESGNAPIMIN